MNNLDAGVPATLEHILRDAAGIGFTLSSEPRTGALLRLCAASKPHGRLLEIGTGAGAGTAWLLAGMDRASTLTSVDNNAGVQAIARRHLGHDPRVTFLSQDGAGFLERSAGTRFDLVYADAWPGKFTHLSEALSLVAEGGIYFIDDLLPQPSWPDGHAAKVPPLVADLLGRPGFVSVRMDWASGLMMLVRTAADTRGDQRTI